MFGLFAGLLDSWNVERKGEAGPGGLRGRRLAEPGFHHEDHRGARPGVRQAGPYLAGRILDWRDEWAGELDSDDALAAKPGELTQAQLILGLCDRFHCVPEVAKGMGAGVLRLLEIEALGKPDAEGGE